MRSDRGMSMLMVMFFALLATVLAAAIAGMSFAPSNLSGKFNFRLQCENLTQSVLNETFARLKKDPSFRETVVRREGRGFAVVTFSSADASRYKVPVSVNALSSDQPVVGTKGRTLPSHSAQLFALATVGETNSLVVEQVLLAPKFPYCIASSSGMVCSGPMLVAGVDELSGSALPADLKPGHVVSNGNLSLAGPSTRVTGDVKAVGTVRNSGAVVEGQVEERHSEVALPAIPVASYDPGTDPAVVRSLDASYPGLRVDGLARRAGDLNLNVSGLTLENGLLYVDGDLTVNGGVSGLGAIVCTGNVTVNGGGTLSTTNLAAIVAGGRVVLNGTPGSRGYFRGLVYTETGMDASHLTLVGAFVHRSASGAGELRLDGCDVIYDPAAVQIEWAIPGFGESSSDARNPARLGEGVTAEDFFNRDTGHFDPARVDGQTVPLLFEGDTFHSIEEAAAAATTKGSRPPRLDDGTRHASWEEYFQAQHDRIRSTLIMMDQQYQARPSQALLRGQFSLDLNQFLNTSDRMRVVFWRDL